MKALDASTKGGTGCYEGTGCFNKKGHWVLEQVQDLGFGRALDARSRLHGMQGCQKGGVVNLTRATS